MPTTILDGETYEQARHRRLTEEAKVIEKIQQDEIIRMAREAGFETEDWANGTHVIAYELGREIDITNELERFAALVAAHERNRIFDESKHIIKRAEARGAIFEREKQAEQEPVAWGMTNETGEVLDCISHKYKITQPCAVDFDLPLYAAPVRTKDLTDDEIRKLWSDAELDITWFARALIAADREKNNANNNT